MMKDKKLVSPWQQIEESLKDWYLALENYKKEYGDEFTDEIENVYNKEWQTISKIKQWVKKQEFEDFENHQLSEEELNLFNQLLEKSNHVYFDKDHKHPYAMLFFLPLSMWNDDPESKKLPAMLTTHSLLPRQRKRLEEIIKVYLNDFLYSSLSDKDYTLSTFPVLSGKKMKNYYLATAKENEKIDPISLLNNETIKALSDFKGEQWLTSGLLPILIRSDKYSNIADTDFTFNNVFVDNLNTIYNNNRLISGFPCYLDESVLTLENMKWDLWKFEYLDKDTTSEIVKKEILFTCQYFGDSPVSLKTLVKDHYANGKCIEHEYEKDAVSFEDIQFSMVLQNMEEKTEIIIKNKKISENEVKLRQYKIMKDFLSIEKSIGSQNHYFLTDEKAPEGILLN